MGIPLLASPNRVWNGQVRPVMRPVDSPRTKTMDLVTTCYDQAHAFVYV
jgi:hypothetical protein